MMNKKGMTLVELMVSLVIVMIVLAGAGTAYLKIGREFTTQSGISESYMENLSGLELLRYDIGMAGYGLPRNFDPATLALTEAVSSAAVPNPNTFNDATNNLRGAFAFSNNGATGSNNSDVLVIKSQAANINQTSRKWSTLYYNGANWVVHKWNYEDGEMELDGSDRCILVDKNKNLLTVGGGWFFQFDTDYFGDATAISAGLTNNQVYLIYGIDDSAGLGMPFNRVDYYLSRSATNFPTRCFPNSFSLNRATINQNGGARNPQPLIDCVEDFQVAFGRDTDGDLVVDTWSDDINSITDSNGNGIGDEIIEQVREVRAFILFHEGGRDNDYLSTQTITLGDADTGNLSQFTPAGAATNYRWKVLKLAIKPINLR